ncbi:MAG: AAA family ATPase [Gammaproteobacteria bacterium]|nr:AAA family ATPase [Gammaproteobacteria bacterium]
MSKYQRWQSKIVVKALKTRRVVIIGGARQCGKTTVAKPMVAPGVTYRTLDDYLLLNIAKTDPQEFVKHSGHLMIIDEVQKAVELLPAIKMRVDEDNRPGQYLLTGSAHIQSLPSVTESLAGRIREVPLRPLSQGEILGHQPNFLDGAFEQKFHQRNNVLITVS